MRCAVLSSEFLEVSGDGESERWSQKIRYIEPFKVGVKEQRIIHMRTQSSCVTWVNQEKGNNANRKSWSRGRHDGQAMTSWGEEA